MLVSDALVYRRSDHAAEETTTYIPELSILVIISSGYQRLPSLIADSLPLRGSRRQSDISLARMVVPAASVSYQSDRSIERQYARGEYLNGNYSDISCSDISYKSSIH
jgi:hypothetical protein